MNEKDEFGFKFNIGDVTYHICDKDRIYRYLIVVKQLYADGGGVSRSYSCQSLDGNAGLFFAANDRPVVMQEWELTK